MVVVRWRAPRTAKGGGGKGGGGGVGHGAKRLRAGGAAASGAAAGLQPAAARRTYVHMVLEKRDIEMHEAVLLAECAALVAPQLTIPWPPGAGSPGPYLRYVL